MNVSKRTFIIEQGQPTDSLFFIIDGLVRCVHTRHSLSMEGGVSKFNILTHRCGGFRLDGEGCQYTESVAELAAGATGTPPPHFGNLLGPPARHGLVRHQGG